jgi:hypothetical protein
LCSERSAPGSSDVERRGRCTDNGRADRFIYDNGTESDVLLRSLQRALHRDDAGRRITDLSAGPLFEGESEEGDQASGTIYVLRSKSDHAVLRPIALYCTKSA